MSETSQEKETLKRVLLWLVLLLLILAPPIIAVLHQADRVLPLAA